MSGRAMKVVRRFSQIALWGREFQAVNDQCSLLIWHIK